ncbi:MAG: RND family transporter [Sphingomonadales bacterium]
MTILMVGAVGAGITRVEHTTDSRVFFGKHNPFRLAFEALEGRFSESNDLLIVLAPRDGDVFTREVLSAVEMLTEQAWRIPFAARVDSLTNFQYSRAFEDDLIIRDLVVGAAGLGDDELRAVREAALSEPMLNGLIVSPGGDVTGVVVNLIYREGQRQAAEQAAAHVRLLTSRLMKRFPEIRFYLTGSVMMSDAFAEATRRELTTLFPVMLLVIAVMMALLLRSWAGMAAVLSVAIVAASTALGLAGWSGLVLNPGSAAAPTIVLTLAVANSVHILTSFFERQAHGGSRYRAVIEALETNLWPVFLTSATTTIGFLSLNASDSKPFRDLGNLVAVGVGAGFFCAVVFLPALMSMFSATAGKGRPVRFHHVLSRWHGAVARRHRVLFWGCLAVVIGLMTGLSRIELNDSWVEYFDHSFSLRRDTDFVRERLTGVNVVEYVIESGQDSGIYEPAYLERVDRFVAWAERQPEVVNVRAITQILKRLNKNFNGDEPGHFRLPETAALAAQYLLVYEMSLPFGLDLNDRIDVAKLGTRVSVATRGLSSRQLRTFDKRAAAWFAADNDKHSAGTGHGLHEPLKGTGVPIMFAHLSDRNIRSMLWGTMLALCLVSAILIIALRSVKVGLISLVPNLVPAVTAFGLWGFLVGEVGVAISIVAAVTFGIVVDDTIHLLSKYLRARRSLGLGPEASIRYAFLNVGKALLITTLVLVAGFLTLTMSGFQPTWGMGVLASVTIAIALPADFMLLPALLLKLDRPGRSL